MLKVANGWIRLENQLNHLEHLQPSMDQDHQLVYRSTLTMLQVKLEVVGAILRSVIEPPASETGSGDFKPKWLKHAWKKGGLDRAVEELETWMGIADLTWFLVLKKLIPQGDALSLPDRAAVAGPPSSILPLRASLRGMPSDSNLSQEVTLSKSPEYLSHMDTIVIPMCNAQLGKLPGSPTSYVLDKLLSQPSTQLNDAKRNTRDLARKLQHHDPDAFGLLHCEGFVATSTEASVESALILRLPPQRSNPRSLRDVLLSDCCPDSLSTRVAMARDLAKAVGFVHMLGFVHKNVRPESVLGFDGPSSPSLFLIGFEKSRKDDGRTRRVGDETFDGNLYLHPDRQFLSGPRHDYIMQHDIYSLGVCLLEMGLWRSLLEYTASDGDSNTIRPSALLGAPPDAESDRQLLRYVVLSAKDHLLGLARSELRRIMGTAFAKVVETCLTCLDEGNDDFGEVSEFQDDDGVLVGARYIEKVILRLSDITL